MVTSVGIVTADDASSLPSRAARYTRRRCGARLLLRSRRAQGERAPSARPRDPPEGQPQTDEAGSTTLNDHQRPAARVERRRLPSLLRHHDLVPEAMAAAHDGATPEPLVKLWHAARKVRRWIVDQLPLYDRARRLADAAEASSTDRRDVDRRRRGGRRGAAGRACGEPHRGARSRAPGCAPTGEAAALLARRDGARVPRVGRRRRRAAAAARARSERRRRRRGRCTRARAEHAFLPPSRGVSDRPRRRACFDGRLRRTGRRNHGGGEDDLQGTASAREAEFVAGRWRRRSWRAAARKTRRLRSAHLATQPSASPRQLRLPALSLARAL